jgi:hypothetical protein
MDRILDLVFGTPLARRMLAGYVERGLLALAVTAAGYAKLQAGSFESDAAKWAADAAPFLVALIFGWIAQARMKKAEVTIAVASQTNGSVPRASIDAAVKSMDKDEKNQVLAAAERA